MTPVMIPNPASLIQSIAMSVNFNITMLETNPNDQHVCLLELNTLTITIVIYFTQQDNCLLGLGSGALIV